MDLICFLRKSGACQNDNIKTLETPARVNEDNLVKATLINVKECKTEGKIFCLVLSIVTCQKKVIISHLQFPKNEKEIRHIGIS